MKRVFRWLPALGLMVLIISLGLNYSRQQDRIASLEKDLASQERELVRIGKEVKQMETEIDMVDDPEYIEDLARGKLGMVGPKDLIYVDKSQGQAEEEVQE